MSNTNVKIKVTEQQALPGTDGVEGGGARVINHPLLPSQAPPATVSNTSESSVVEGPPDGVTQTAPSVPASEGVPTVDGPTPAPSAAIGADRVPEAQASQGLDLEAQTHRYRNVASILKEFRCCEIFTGLVTFAALVVVWYYNSKRA